MRFQLFISLYQYYYQLLYILIAINILLYVDPRVFAIIRTISLTSILCTPPVGLILFVDGVISGSSLLDFSKAFLPFLIASFFFFLLFNGKTTRYTSSLFW